MFYQSHSGEPLPSSFDRNPTSNCRYDQAPITPRSEHIDFADTQNRVTLRADSGAACDTLATAVGCGGLVDHRTNHLFTVRAYRHLAAPSGATIFTSSPGRSTTVRRLTYVVFGFYSRFSLFRVRALLSGNYIPLCSNRLCKGGE